MCSKCVYREWWGPISRRGVMWRDSCDCTDCWRCTGWTVGGPARLIVYSYLLLGKKARRKQPEKKKKENTLKETSYSHIASSSFPYMLFPLFFPLLLLFLFPTACILEAQLNRTQTHSLTKAVYSTASQRREFWLLATQKLTDWGGGGDVMQQAARLLDGSVYSAVSRIHLFCLQYNKKPRGVMMTIKRGEAIKCPVRIIIRHTFLFFFLRRRWLCR